MDGKVVVTKDPRHASPRTRAIDRYAVRSALGCAPAAGATQQPVQQCGCVLE
jgi:hypothetical protein